METKSSKSNYFFTIVKLFLFLLIFSFLVAMSREFFHNIKSLKDFNLDLFFISILSCFVFYIFFASLNGIYKTIQNFFFHSSQFGLFIPTLLILLGIGYYIIPKVFNVDFNRDVFLFAGGFILIAHLIYIANETKGATFSDFINYLFIFSILYIINLIIFEAYLRIAFNIDISKINIDGARGGATIIKDMFLQIFQNKK